MERNTVIFIVSLALIGLFLSEINNITGYALRKTTCSDSDNGLNYNTKGTVTVLQRTLSGRITSRVSYPDVCKDSNTLKEASCTNLKQIYKEYNCLSPNFPAVCQDGACKQCQKSTCLSIGKSCGSWPDGCGGTINCGTCTSGQTCSNGVCSMNCNNGKVCELNDDPLCFECKLPADWVCDHDTICENNEPITICDDCPIVIPPDRVPTFNEIAKPCQTSFNFATIYVYEKNTDLSSYGGNYVDTNIPLSIKRLEDMSKMANLYSNKLGREFVTFNFDENIALIEVNPENKFVFINEYSQIDFKDGVPYTNMSGWSLIFDNVIKEFYKTHPDNYDFINIYTAFPYSCYSTFDMTSSQYIIINYTMRANFHIGVLNKVNNNGAPGLHNYRSYYLHGEHKRLLGYNLLSQLPFIYRPESLKEFSENQIACINLHSIGHETEHHWAAYVGDNYGSGGNLQILTPDRLHWYPGLKTINDPLGGLNWKDNEDGSFTLLPPNEFCAERTDLYSPRFYVPEYSELTLYLMGAIDKTKVSPILLLDWTFHSIKIGDTITANSKYIYIEDIISRYGEVSCFEPVWE